MSNRTRLGIGIIGSIIAALCTFTPALTMLLGAFGVSAVPGWLDQFLLPLLAVFLSITVYALWQRRKMANDPS